jgi:hypothetical protein
LARGSWRDMKREELVFVDTGTIMKNVKIKNEVKMKSSQLERLKIEVDKSVFIRQTPQARYTLRKILLHFLNDVDVLFSAGTPNNRTILYERSNVGNKSSP